MTHSYAFATNEHTLQDHLLAIIRAAIDGADARTAVVRSLTAPAHRTFLTTPVHVIAAGKAAASMIGALADDRDLTVRMMLAVGTHRPPDLPETVEWREAGHPLPDERSVAAGRRAQEVAAAVAPDETLILLLSGGASAVLAVPAEGLTLADKRDAIDLMMRSGADIHALNTVRKHLSALKGGQLASVCRGSTLTLAVSDVVGDDLSVIGSGPGVPDQTTWMDAAAALGRWGGTAHAVAVRRRIADGIGGLIPDTPKPTDPRLARAHGHVIATRQDALDAARRVAERLGYLVTVLPQSITGEARQAALDWYEVVQRHASLSTQSVCVMSAGETTVRVTGRGQGGRNQEFALALAEAVQSGGRDHLAGSVGTDGIDGPTDAAGAFVTRSTLARAAELGLPAPSVYLAENNSYAFFDRLGDLIRLGRTDTNVGDLQIYLAAAGC